MLQTRFARFLGSWLLLLTAAAFLLPWDPLGPFDPRDYSVLPGVVLHYPLPGALFEPLFAPAHLILGAPDYRLAAASVLLWGVLAAVVVVTLRSRRRHGRLASAARGLAAGGIAGLLIFAYVLANAIWHPPGWRLSVADPELMVADLQSHTHGSHDGLVAPERNLAWHTDRGYDVVAVTEHIDPAGSHAAAAAATAPGAPAVIPGVEMNSEQEEFLLGLGLSPDRPVLEYVQQRQDYARHFVAHVHGEHGGAVIAMAWRIEADQIRRLVEVGDDAFEIANTAHPEIPAEVRAAMLEAHRQGRVLVASTDWHGWGGLSRTWTLVRVPGWRALTPDERQAAVVARLRARDTAAFTPVTAGRLEPPTLARAIFAPVVEGVRYAAELSPPRVAAWWLWGFGLLALLRRGDARGRSVVRPLGGLAALGLGLLLLVGGLRLTGLPEAAAGAEFAAEIGRQALWVGAGVVALALAVMVRGRRTGAASSR